MVLVLILLAESAEVTYYAYAELAHHLLYAREWVRDRCIMAPSLHSDRPYSLEHSRHFLYSGLLLPSCDPFLAFTFAKSGKVDFLQHGITTALADRLVPWELDSRTCVDVVQKMMT
jgi:hypothetical protein